MEVGEEAVEAVDPAQLLEHRALAACESVCLQVGDHSLDLNSAGARHRLTRHGLCSLNL